MVVVIFGVLLCLPVLRKEISQITPSLFLPVAEFFGGVLMAPSGKLESDRFGIR
jgi:hypothetical protein